MRVEQGKHVQRVRKKVALKEVTLERKSKGLKYFGGGMGRTVRGENQEV